MLGQEYQLFCNHNLQSVFESHEQAMIKEIYQYNADRFLHTSAADLADYFREKYALAPIRVLDEQASVDWTDAKIESHGVQCYISGTAIIFTVPFDGNPDLFKYRPSRWAASYPRGIVRSNTLELWTHCRPDDDAEAARRELDRRLASVRKYVDWLTDDLDRFNQSLRDKARTEVDRRREKLLKDQELVAALGFPLKKRTDAAMAYVPLKLRKKLPLQPPPASTELCDVEPYLRVKHYEHILDVISKTATMLERSPEAFKNMGEELLRFQFLVPLNSLYEGQVTGETFNFTGKTDILVRVRDRCVFIAECKVWRGQRAFLQSIDQLFGYATWRDTKTAILVFNRNKNLSAVLEKIPGAVRTHPSYKRDVEYSHETGFRFILGHRDDPRRELILTVLVFEVPM